MLEFSYGGTALTFLPHDAAFCRAATIERIAHLRQALMAQQETFKAATAELQRQVDEVLAEYGLGTIGDFANQAYAQAMAHVDIALELIE